MKTLKTTKTLKGMSNYRFRIAGSQYNVIIEAENWIKAWEVFKNSRK